MVDYSKVGWQKEHAAALKASRNPIPPFRGGGGYIHVPGQTGMYSEYLALGGPPEGIGSANIMAAGRMSMYRAGVRLAGSPLRAPITYTSIKGVPTFVATESLKGGKEFMPLPGSPLARGVFGPIGKIVEGGTRLVPGGVATASASGSGFVPLPSASVSTLGGGAIAPVDIGGMGGISGITTGMASVGSDIVNTVKPFIPLIVIGGIAILGIKMLMGRK